MASNSDENRKHAKRPPRKPVTIDLDATEVASEAAPEDEKSTATPEPAAGGAATAAEPPKDAGTPEPDSGNAAEAAAELAGADAASEGADAPEGDGSGDADEAAAEETVPPPVAEKRSPGTAGWFAAALAGGAVAVIGGYGLQLAGVLPAPEPAGLEETTSALSDARKRIVALEGKIAVLADNAARPAVAPEMVTALEGRVAALEKAPVPAASADAPAATDLSALGERVAALEASARSTGDAVGALSGRADQSAERIEALAPLAGEVAELRKLVSGGAAGTDVALESLQSEIAGLKDALATLRGEVSAASDRPAVDPALARRLDELDATLAAQAERLDGVAAAKPDETLAASVAALTSRVDASEKQAEARGAAVDGVKSTADGLTQSLNGATTRIEELSTGLGETASRIDALAKTVEAAGARIDQLEAELGGVPAKETAARAVAVAALSDAVEAGRPYATELAAVSRLLGDTVDLSVLTAHAQTGIATRTALIARFGEVAKAVLATATTSDAESGIIDRLWNNAQSAVRVRPVGDIEGSDIAAIVARMEAAVAKGDFEKALGEWSGLPETAKAAGADWAAAVTARLEADRLVRKVSVDVLTMLGATGN